MVAINILLFGKTVGHILYPNTALALTLSDVLGQAIENEEKLVK